MRNSLSFGLPCPSPILACSYQRCKSLRPRISVLAGLLPSCWQAVWDGQASLSSVEDLSPFFHSTRLALQNSIFNKMPCMIKSGSYTIGCIHHTFWDRCDCPVMVKMSYINWKIPRNQVILENLPKPSVKFAVAFVEDRHRHDRQTVLPESHMEQAVDPKLPGVGRAFYWQDWALTNCNRFFRATARLPRSHSGSCIPFQEMHHTRMNLPVSEPCHLCC